MPELPEVETVVRTLEKQVGKATIKNVEIIYDKIIDNVDADFFCQTLKGQTFRSYNRRGKFLVFTLDDYILVVHLRMEGKFYYYPNEYELLKHTHLIFTLNNGYLAYNDTRKFGRFYLYKKDQTLTCLEKLGLEPFDDKLTARYLKDYCRNISKTIKEVLLDQHMISGIGNIYDNEILFLSKLNPYTPACLISLEKWDEIIKNTREVLREAIKAGGTTIRSYTSSLGVTGLFQQNLYVHMQKECQICGSALIKKFIGGRGTYYCPNCQKTKASLIAITGNIGSGKSQAMEIIRQHGYLTISCDDINSQLLEKEDVKDDLAQILGVANIDKKIIAQKIFSNKILKEKVEGYLHQQIKEAINKWAEQNQQQQVLFVEVPLLFEVGWDYYFDYNILITAKEETIYKRLLSLRNMDENEISARLKSQINNREKISLCDKVIYNDSSLANLSVQVEKTINAIVKLKVIEKA